MESLWYTYILRCSDQTLYTGITTDPARRLEAHNNGGRGAKYVRSRRPAKLVYQEQHANRSEAARRELQIKKMTRADKTRLIASRKNAP